MSNDTFSRRQFLQTTLYSSLLYGAGSISSLVPQAHAMPTPLTNPILIDLFLNGGPDMRHLIVPAYDSNPSSFGGKYWANRQRSHNLAGSNQTPQQRWNQDYYPITVGGTNWNSGLVDVASISNGATVNDGVTFGIWKEAGWLIDMFRAGHVALIFNAVGGTNRAHDLSSLMLHQGDVLTSLNNQDRSGWGGRLARSAGGSPVALTRSPSAFTFGPIGTNTPYPPNGIDNSDLAVVNDSRNLGLFDPAADDYEHNDHDNKMARAAKSYYAALRNEQIGDAYQKFMSHEFKTREFGQAIDLRIGSTPVPELIEALMSDGISINNQAVNPDPANGNARRVLRSAYSFGRQIRNLYDIIAWNDLFDARVLSMNYGGWDSHSEQRRVPNVLATDPTNPYVGRGIESGLRDIFEGQFGQNPSNPNALHAGFSALWQSLSQNDRNNIVITIAGEFGRQIRDNGDRGTDHGKGNLMFVISEACQGGIYGEMFPTSELVKYDEPPNRTPDIDPRTEIDQFFSQVCNWVAPGSGNAVFPRMASGSPDLESGVTFNSLFS